LTGGLNIPRLFPLQKEEEGVPVSNVQPSPVGTIPSNATAGPVWFPSTKDELYGTSVDQLLQLAIFYNDTFGILDSDELPLKRLKFITFIAC
jgi:hypothetical protein